MWGLCIKNQLLLHLNHLSSSKYISRSRFWVTGWFYRLRMGTPCCKLSLLSFLPGCSAPSSPAPAPVPHRQHLSPQCQHLSSPCQRLCSQCQHLCFQHQCPVPPVPAPAPLAPAPVPFSASSCPPHTSTCPPSTSTCPPGASTCPLQRHHPCFQHQWPLSSLCQHLSPQRQQPLFSQGAALCPRWPLQLLRAAHIRCLLGFWGFSRAI